jgi:hypothetical protein
MRKVAQYDLDVNLGISTSDVKAIATVSDGSGGCKGKRPSTWSKRIASELISLYTVVDRDEFDHLLDEQRKDLEGSVVEDSDLIEAGQLLGADAIMFVEVGCNASKNSIADVKLIRTTTGEIFWSAHGENASPEIIGKGILEALESAE